MPQIQILGTSPDASDLATHVLHRDLAIRNLHPVTPVKPVTPFDPSVRTRPVTAGPRNTRYHMSTGNPLAAVDPIVKSWQMGQPALGFSYRQPTIHWSEIADPPGHRFHRRRYDFILQPDGTWQSVARPCEHHNCRATVQALADSQRGLPKHPDQPIHPFRTYQSKASEPPPESTQARKHGTIALSLDMPMSDSDGNLTTLAESLTITDRDTTPYDVMDPETRDQITWEQSARYSGPTTYFRRKWSDTRQEDIVVIDRWGQRNEPTHARCWWDLALTNTPETIDPAQLRTSDFTPAFVFELPRPFDYRAAVNAYIDRIAKAHDGHFPTWEEQRRLARKGAQDAEIRRLRPPRCPIEHQLDRDPFRYRHLDATLHEPHEVIDVTDLFDDFDAIHLFGRPLDQLYEEELQDLEAHITEILREQHRLDDYTTYAVRNHPNFLIATQARLHSNGAEFLAGLDDTIEQRPTPDPILSF